MARITETQALIVLPLAHMKLELRIPAAELSHDGLLTSQIVSAVSYVARSTEAEGDALLPLRAAAAAIVRDLYDGERDVKKTAAHNTWMEPFRSYKAG